MKRIALSLSVLACFVALATAAIAQEKPAAPAPAGEPGFKPLRIIAFGAHPDDPEFQIGGCAIK